MNTIKLLTCLFSKNKTATQNLITNNLNSQVCSAYEIPVPIFRQPIGDGESRIVGGKPAAKGQFPHQAGVYLNGRNFCGGSLISKNWVLTAGHCVADRFTEWTVHLGAHNIKDITEPGREIIVSKKAIRHENYSATEILNDVGVINLPEDVKFTGKSALAMNSESTFMAETKV